MRNLVMDKMVGAQMIVFNRLEKGADVMPFHKIARAANRKVDILYDYTDGSTEFDEIEDPLPYDLNAPIIEIKDEDFAIFYRDLSEDFKKYIGKKVRFKGICATDESLPKSHFAIGRHIMVCCADDIAYRGIVAKGTCGKTVKTRDWVTVTGTLAEEYSKLYQGRGPVMSVELIESAQKPEQEVATFY
jgi:uncharacterized repeat protein (TIGR03943 family)